MTCRDGSPCVRGDDACPLHALAGLCAVARADPRYAAVVIPPPCRHRATRWNCGGEMTCTCALGRGQAGIIEASECDDCPNRDPSGNPRSAPIPH